MDLKVQADGSGGLEELKEEFMDGRSVRLSRPSFGLVRCRFGNPKLTLCCGWGYTGSNTLSFESRTGTLGCPSLFRS